jgi:SOUL heme-binding protein
VFNRLPPNFKFCEILLATLLTTTLPMPIYATPESEYQIVNTFADFEVREYAPYAVAQTVVIGPAENAGSQAFPILAGYIFGKNKGEKRFSMTAPVTQTAAPVKLEMTAPVTQTNAQGGVLVQFVLPKGVTATNAPEPLDARVQLRDIPATRLAVIRYSGLWSQPNDSKHLEKLHAAMRAANLAWAGEAVYSRYNAPFTPWFMRRNEIWLQLAPTG